MSQSEPRQRILFLSLCRDCEATLPTFLAILHAIESNPDFEVHACFGENGSRDRTVALLDAAAATNPRIQRLDTGFMSGVRERLARMAAGREFLKSRLPPASPGDVVIVADPDLVFAPNLTPALLRKALIELEEPGVIGVCSHSLPRYYDVLALVEEANSTNPALSRYLPSLKPRTLVEKFLGLPKDFWLHSRVVAMQKRLGSGAGLKVISAFNGLCIYRRPLFDAVSYLGTPTECEHVHLHRAMHRLDGGRIRISDVIGVIAPAEHIVSVGQALAGRLANALKSRKLR